MTKIPIVIGLQVCRRLWPRVLWGHPFLDSSAASRRDAKAGIRDVSAKSPWVSPVGISVLFFSRDATHRRPALRCSAAINDFAHWIALRTQAGSEQVCCVLRHAQKFRAWMARNDAARVLPGVGFANCWQLPAIAVFQHACFAAAKRPAFFHSPPQRAAESRFLGRCSINVSLQG